MSLVAAALRFAAHHHGHQFRKGTRIPYLSHLLNVCAWLARREYDDEILAAALLHDVVEDTDATLGQVTDGFGTRVATIVAGATELEKLEKKALNKAATWQQRKEQTLHFLRHDASYEQLLVSGADKLDNLHSLVTDHALVGEALWLRFNAPKALQQWYYTSVALLLEEKAELDPVFGEMATEMKAGLRHLF
ncbi:MAG TPA: HD domain-containing protein [Lacibacter sp.]|nr:HD domain-containing protein [Lacibacter sp.]HMO88261.1 HD domain-containing protein [Lacibacter sp.]